MTVHPATPPVRVLIVDDSPTVRRYLTDLINESNGLEVIGVARDGEEALPRVKELKPDVISMDIRMPGIDGLEAIRQIMSRRPTPVVVVSGLLDRDVDLSFQALQAGALAVVEKPPHREDAAFAEKYRQLVNTLRAMSRVRVVRRWDNEPGNNPSDSQLIPRYPLATGRLRFTPEVIAIGASAGGPSALNAVLKDLPQTFNIPILIVQHMPDEFLPGLARWLNKSTPLTVRLATDGLVLEPGVVNLAGGGAHLSLGRKGSQLVVRLLEERGDYLYQPSVDVLFESVARVCGSASVGVVMTGMGTDGASGLLALRQAGALTLAQDEASCTVFGMPGAAINRGAVEHVLALSNVATTLARLI